MTSKKYTLNENDLKKIFKGLCIACAGAILTYAQSTIPNIDFGQYTEIVVALNSVFVNIGMKYISGKK